MRDWSKELANDWEKTTVVLLCYFDDTTRKYYVIKTNIGNTCIICMQLRRYTKKVKKGNNDVDLIYYRKFYSLRHSRSSEKID